MSTLNKKIFGIPLYRWLILGGLGIGLLILSVIIRGQLNIDWNVQSLRSFVESLGVWAPLSFVGILTFRFIFLIPTGLLLLAAGIVFGPIEGTLYAGIGLTGSGMIKYGFTSIVGRDALLKQLPPALLTRAKSMSAQKMGIWALAGVCAYPFFPKHVFQFAAILSGMGLAGYTLAVLAGSFVRAALFSNIGEAISSGAGLATATGLLMAGIILPMSVPSWRRWMLAPLTSNPTTKP